MTTIRELIKELQKAELLCGSDTKVCLQIGVLSSKQHDIEVKGADEYDKVICIRDSYLS